jgi:hypothetical protein
MVRVEKVSGPRVDVRGIGHYEIGDVDDVSAADAEYLVEERGDFRYVDGPPSDDTEEAASTSESASSEDTSEDSNDETSDETDEPDPASEAAHLADESWQRAVAAVEDGEADAYLDELEAADDRDSVQEAIEERRAELEG